MENLTPLKGQTDLSILMLQGNKIADLKPLVQMCQADAKSDRRFAPYLRLYMAGNPLSDTAKGAQVAALKEVGVRIMD